MGFENIHKNYDSSALIKEMSLKESKEINFDLFLKSLSNEDLWREFSGTKYITANIIASNFHRMGETEVLEKLEEQIKGINYYVAQELINCLEGAVNEVNYRSRSAYEHIILNKPNNKRSEKEKLIIEQIKLRTENLSLIKDKLIEISKDENLNYIMKLRILDFLENFSETRIKKSTELADKVSEDNCMVTLGEEMILLNNSQRSSINDFIKHKEQEKENRVLHISQTIGSNLADQLATRFKKDLTGENQPTNFQEIKQKFPDSILLKDYIDKQSLLLDGPINNEEYCRDFLFLSSPLIRNLLKKDFNVNLEETSVKTQFFLLNFLKNKNSKEIELFREFCLKFGEDGLNSFLSLEIGVELGNKILNIAKNLDYPVAKKIFTKISSLTNWIEKNDDEIKNSFNLNESFDYHELRLELLSKVGKIIQKFSNLIKQSGLSSHQIEGLILEFDRTKGEMIILATVLKKLKEKNQNIKFELIKDLELSIKNYGEELPENDRETILSIADDNWKSFGNDKMAQVVIDDLKKTLDESTNQKTYTLKYKDEIIGFVRFEDKGKNVVHAGSLNVSKDIRGLSIGTELMENALIAESNEKILEATASVKIPAGCSYVEKIGFVADGLIYDYKDTEESLFSIKLDKKRNLNYKLRNEGKEEKISQEELKEMLNDYNELDSLIGQEIIVLSFDLNKEMTEYQEALKTLLPEVDDNLKTHKNQKNKYTLTRYFYDKRNDPRGNKRYLVFEKNN